MSRALEDIQRLILLNFDHQVRLEVGGGQTLGVGVSVPEVDPKGVVIIVSAAQSLVQPRAPVVALAPAVQAPPFIAFREREISSLAVSQLI